MGITVIIRFPKDNTRYDATNLIALDTAVGATDPVNVARVQTFLDDSHRRLAKQFVHGLLEHIPALDRAALLAAHETVGSLEATIRQGNVVRIIKASTDMDALVRYVESVQSPSLT